MPLSPLQAFQAYRHDDRLVICTGSATGAYSPAAAAAAAPPTPSFALMDVDGSKVGGGWAGAGVASGRQPWGGAAGSCCLDDGSRRRASRLLVHASISIKDPPLPAHLLHIHTCYTHTCLLQATVYVYELGAGDQVKVDKLEFSRPSPSRAL